MKPRPDHPRRVLVTGGAGYIGSHVCAALSHSGFVPFCVDDYSTGQQSLVRYGPSFLMHLPDVDSFTALLRDIQPDAVVHLAALCVAGESWARESDYLRVNHLGTQCVLEAMLATGVRKLVFASTCAVYGNADQIKVDESAPINLINPYARSKHLAEESIRSIAAKAAIDATIFRFFNAAGSTPEERLGERVSSGTTLIPSILRVALGIQPVLNINGADYPTPDGTCVRDFLHARDIAGAVVAAIAGLSSGVSGTMNLGADRGISVLEAVRVAEEVTGKRIPTTIAPRRKGDPIALLSDSTRARERLSWAPQWSSLENILRSSWLFAKLDTSEPAGTASVTK